MKKGKYTYRISLRLEHPDADLLGVPTRLGLTSDYMWNKGDPCILPDGRTWRSPRWDSFCEIQLSNGSELDGFANGLKSAIALLTPNKAFLDELSANGVKAGFFVHWTSDHQSSETLDREVLRDLADLQIPLDLYFYADNDYAHYAPKP
jgi:hypothetical protein